MQRNIRTDGERQLDYCHHHRRPATRYVLNGSFTFVLNALGISGEEPKLAITDILTGEQKEITLPSEEQTAVKEAIEDNVDTDVNMVQVNESSSETGWGNWGAATATDGPNDSGWGGWTSADGQPSSWDTSTDKEPADGTDTNVPLAPWTDFAPSWGREMPSLMTFLGPTVFPLTHTTGIVEFSTRRVREVHPPTISSKATSGKRSAKRKRGNAEGQWMPSASSVEAELDAQFAKVVLAPWGFEGGDISKPEIWATSRGAVIDPNLSTDSGTPDATGGEGKQKPHNPLTDDIVLLVQPHLLDTLSLVPGFGLGAMWVQLVRSEDAEKEGAGGDRGSECPKTYWYHEDLTGIFPSFYTPGT